MFKTLKIGDKQLSMFSYKVNLNLIASININAQKKVNHKISTCCFINNFGNSLGNLMPDENKNELIKL
ncbi:hypothetical protein BAX95_17945 [Elizabethkingia meningoseptica]|nr:hypothetical protein BAX95_17945 [Elizabethkingia meningoseptica]